MNSSVPSTACFASRCDYWAGQLEGAPAPGRLGGYPRPAADYPWAFTYGYLEVRWKMPTDAPGFFPAFWMIDTDGQLSNAPTLRNYYYHWEIDMEIPGTPGWPGKGAGYSDSWMASPVFMSYGYHNKETNLGAGRVASYRVNFDGGDAGKGFPPLSPRSNGECPGGSYDYSKDWHTFAIDWGPTFVRWWIDRQVCGEYVDLTGATIPGPDTQMFPIIWIGVDQVWNRSLSANRDSSCADNPSLIPCDLTGRSGASKSLLIDYLRLWQQQ